MPSRYLCDVLEDMRKMYETRNFSGLMGAIEDAQRMASRMEAGLGDKHSIEDYEKRVSEAKRAARAAEKEQEVAEATLAEKKEELKALNEQIKRATHTLKKTTKVDTPCPVCGLYGVACECGHGSP